MVLEGELSIGIREDDGERFVHLGPHDVFVVPKGIDHRPTSHDGASVLLLEPAGTLSTGDYRGTSRATSTPRLATGHELALANPWPDDGAATLGIAT